MLRRMRTSSSYKPSSIYMDFIKIARKVAVMLVLVELIHMNTNVDSTTIFRQETTTIAGITPPVAHFLLRMMKHMSSV